MHGLSANMFHFHLFLNAATEQNYIISGIFQYPIRLLLSSIHFDLCGKWVNIVICYYILNHILRRIDVLERWSTREEKLIHQIMVQLTSLTMSNFFLSY